MAEGEVLCLDAANEKFVLQKDGSYELAKIKKFSFIDINEQYCLSVSEKGEGYLHLIGNEQKQNTKRVTFTMIYSFQVTERVSAYF